jgi:hypothetical protein
LLADLEFELHAPFSVFVHGVSVGMFHPSITLAEAHGGMGQLVFRLVLTVRCRMPRQLGHIVNEEELRKLMRNAVLLGADPVSQNLLSNMRREASR